MQKRQNNAYHQRIKENEQQSKHVIQESQVKLEKQAIMTV